jgi:hypothetical protein
MSEKCELLEQCGFFKKFQDINELACRGFINRYCNGPDMEKCKRKEYRQKYGTPPSEDMMPNGLTFICKE